MTGQVPPLSPPSEKTVEAVLLNDTRVDRHHGCTTVIETIDTLASRNNIRITARAPAHADWRANDAIRQAINRSDIVIINGEGTIHHDRPAGLALLAAGPRAKAAGKKAVLLNSTWQANGPEAIEALRSFDIVTVRESASEAELAAHGIMARRIPDLALYHRPTGTEAREGTIYTDSVDGPKALALYRRMWELGTRPVPIVDLPHDPVNALRWLMRWGNGWTSLLNPQHLADAAKATLQDYRHQDSSRDATTASVAESELLITGRFHMLIFALAAGTPVLALASNSHKNEATLADAGLEPWRMVDKVTAIDEQLIARASQWHGQERAALDSFLAAGRSDMEALFADIRRLALDDRAEG